MLVCEGVCVTACLSVGVWAHVHMYVDNQRYYPSGALHLVF